MTWTCTTNRYMTVIFTGTIVARISKKILPNFSKRLQKIVKNTTLPSSSYRGCDIPDQSFYFQYSSANRQSVLKKHEFIFLNSINHKQLI